MLPYVVNLKAALEDTGRRLALKSGAGVLILIGVGFLIAALWTGLAYHLHWGAMWASVAIGGVFVVIGLIVLATSGGQRHRVPPISQLTADMNEVVRTSATTAIDTVMDRVGAKTDETVNKVRATAERVAGQASQTFHSMVDNVAYKANSLADGAEARAQSFAHKAEDRAAKAMGMSTPELEDRIAEGVDRAKSSNLAAVAPVVGAFAVGLTLANRLWGRRDDNDALIDEDDDFDDDLYAYVDDEE